MQLLDFIKWKLWDFKNPKPKVPFGIWCFVGLPGTGKTLSMVEYLDRRNILFPDVEVKVYTNFAYKGENGNIKTIQDIIDTPANSIIALDETQNLFSARNWQKFPPEMLSVITQHRKKAKQLLFTAQDYSLIDSNLRKLCNFIIMVNCVWGRWVIQKAYLPCDFKEVDNDFTAGRHYWRYSFVADNDIFERYDTLKIIEIFDEKKNEQAIHGAALLKC